MKHVRFYEEFKGKRKGVSEGNCFALFLNHPIYKPEGIGALHYSPNSVVCSTSASWDYLRAKCKRVSEARARQIHPNLFAVLDIPEPSTKQEAA